MATKDSDTHGRQKLHDIYRSFEDDVPCWPFGPEKRRVLDVFRTNYGTKLFVENGVLVEEKIQSHGDTAAPVRPVGLPEGVCFGKPNYPVKVVPADDKSQTIDSAKPALEYYNTKHDTHYVLVNPINSNAFLRSGKIWIHASFTAEADTSQAGPGKAELFFAEVMIDGHDGVNAKYVTTACRVIDESKAIDHCEICPQGSFSHPKSKFRQGCYKDTSRALRPRSNGKVSKKLSPYQLPNSWGN